MIFMEKDKHPIVALSQRQISRPTRKMHNCTSLLFSLKETDLELEFYSSLNYKLLKDILDKV